MSLVLTSLLSAWTLGLGSGRRPATFVRVPEGVYQLGKEGYLDNPPRSVKLKAFEIATTTVTNAEFAAFVQDTQHVTVAERNHDGMVFFPPMREFRWKPDPTAQWRYPNGVARGGIAAKSDHPVTGICYDDAEAYCAWAKVRLPTLEEWEVASRAGATSDQFWGVGSEKIVEYANVWHGRDHTQADESDGYMYTSPVGAFKPNRWGLYDVYGNVFQLCSGRLESDRSDRVVHARGGSWWCSRNSCCFFNSVDIGQVNRRASFSNLGFRVARSPLLSSRATRL